MAGRTPNRSPSFERNTHHDSRPEQTCRRLRAAGPVNRARRRRGARRTGRAPHRRRRAAAVRRPGRDRVDRLHGPRQLRDQHPGRRRVRLPAALGRAGRERDRDAVPGDVGEARHRDRPQSRRAVPRPLPGAGRVGHVDRVGDRRDGDRSRRIPRRRARIRVVVSPVAVRGDDRDRVRNLRDPGARKTRFPAAGGCDRGAGRRDRRVLSRRTADRAAGLAGSRVPSGGPANSGSCGADDRSRHHRRDDHAAHAVSAFGAHAGSRSAAQRRATTQSGGGSCVSRTARS